MKQATQWVAALAAFGAVASVSAAPVERPEAGEFTVVKARQAPNVDGKIGAGEWDGALTTSGVIAAFDAKLLTAATEMSVTYDDSKFYFLFNCTRSAGEWKLSKSVRTNDDYSFGDPSVEVWVAPPARVPETYQSVINTYPAVLDQHAIPTRGYTAQGWKGNWNVAVSENEDRYIIEASIPFKDFGVEQVKPDEVWRLLLCRSAIGALPRPQGSWSITTGFSEIPQYPPIRLSVDDVAVQLRGAETLLSGKYQIPMTLKGASAAQKVKVEFRLHQAAKPGDASDIVDVRQIDVPASQSATTVFEGAVPTTWVGKFTENKVSREVPVGHASVTVTRADGAVLFRQTLPYSASGWAPNRPARPADVPPPPPLRVFAKYGPENNVVLLRADILDLANRAEATGGYIRLLDPKDNEKELLKHVLPAFKESYSDAHFKLEGVDVPVHDFRPQDAAYAEIKRIREENKDRAKKLKELTAGAKRPRNDNAPPADPNSPELQPLPVLETPPMTEARVVVLEVGVTDASGKVLATDRQELQLLRKQFAWQNNELGISDKVLAPWTPVQVDGPVLSVWNRKLEVDGLGMLRHVDNGGTSQLQSMRLVAIKDGKEVAIDSSAPRVTKQTDAAVAFTGEGRGAGLKLTGTNTLEFDGYQITELNIAPEGESASIDKLYLEVVLPESEATHFCVSAGGWAASHDVTPERWTSQQTSSGTMINDFVPYIWLTNSDRAFLWLADNDKGWISEDTKTVASQEITRKDGKVTLRINFVEVPATLKSPTTVRYAVQTFPSRPLPAGWRSWVCAGNKPAFAPGAKVDFFFPNFDGTNWVINWPYYGSAFPHSYDRSKKFFDQYANRPNSRPTVGSIAHSIGFYRDYEGRQFTEYSVDWGEMPGQLGNNDVTQSRGPIDLRIYHYNEWARRSGMRALYADENYIATDRNFLTGGAYYRADGRLQPGYTYMGLRNFYKRLNYVFHDAGVQKPNIWLHISSGAAYSAWLGDIFMEAENVGPTDEEFDYLEVLPAARLRAIGSSKANGGPVLVMCQAMRHKTAFTEKHIHQFVGWVQAHDALPEQVLWHAKIAQDARFYRDDVNFFGYWHDNVPVKATTPDAIASVHTTAGRALVWIVNQSREDRKVSVDVDLGKLALDPARTQAFNAETGDEIAIANGRLAVDVLKRDFVAVHLVQRDQMPAGQSFRATFDTSPLADEAIGSQMLSGELGLTSSDRGQALSVATPVTFFPHLNLTDAEGRITFRAKLTGDSGTVLRNATGAKKSDQTPAGFMLDVVKSKSGTALVLKTDAKDGPAVELPLGKPGWYDISLKWKNGAMTMTLGEKTSEPLPLSTLGIRRSTGEVLTQTPNFVFGGQKPRAAVEAIDDLAAWRRAD